MGSSSRSTSPLNGCYSANLLAFQAFASPKQLHLQSVQTSPFEKLIWIQSNLQLLLFYLLIIVSSLKVLAAAPATGTSILTFQAAVPAPVQPSIVDIPDQRTNFDIPPNNCPPQLPCVLEPRFDLHNPGGCVCPGSHLSSCRPRQPIGLQAHPSLQPPQEPLRWPPLFEQLRLLRVNHQPLIPRQLNGPIRSHVLLAALSTVSSTLTIGAAVLSPYQPPTTVTSPIHRFTGFRIYSASHSTVNLSLTLQETVPTLVYSPSTQIPPTRWMSKLPRLLRHSISH